MNDRDPLEDIRQYGQKAKHGWISCDLDTCPHCRGKPGRFKRHGVRSRVFLVLAADMIQRVFSYLTRWKCPLCKRTFTLYPSFAIPFKRYVLPFIKRRCTAYVEDDVHSYREGVEEAGEAIFHEDPERAAGLAPSTLWRWVATLGQFPATLRKALGLIKQKDPATGIFRELGRLAVPARKWRSEARRALLKRCRELVAADRVYDLLFSVSVFPDLATACGWR